VPGSVPPPLHAVNAHATASVSAQVLEAFMAEILRWMPAKLESVRVAAQPE
jgi:hypothetical protein